METLCSKRWLLFYFETFLYFFIGYRGDILRRTGLNIYELNFVDWSVMLTTDCRFLLFSTQNQVEMAALGVVEELEHGMHVELAGNRTRVVNNSLRVLLFLLFHSAHRRSADEFARYKTPAKNLIFKIISIYILKIKFLQCIKICIMNIDGVKG